MKKILAIFFYIVLLQLCVFSLENNTLVNNNATVVLKENVTTTIAPPSTKKIDPPANKTDTAPKIEQKSSTQTVSSTKPPL